MSFARVRIIHGDVSMCVDAPTGRMTTMDLSALHAPAALAAPAPLPPRKAGKARLVLVALAGCAAGAAMATLVLARPNFAQPDWIVEPPMAPSTAPAPAMPPRHVPSIPSVPPAPGGDPFGLRSK